MTIAYTDTNTDTTRSLAETPQATARILYAEAVYNEEEIEAVMEVLRNRRHTLVGGPAVQEFETQTGALFGKSHGVMVNSGSSANLLAIASLELPPGTEVITPALTFGTTVAPLVQCGLIPAFVDVRSDTYVVDVEQIEGMISRKTRAMLIPNLIGNLPDWGQLRQLADRYELIVIEDSADTVGALYDGRPTGDLTDISTASFYASHIVTAGGTGGMLCTNNADVAGQARLLRGWGRSSALTGESERMEERLTSSVDGIPYDGKFVFSAIGYNLHASEMGAAFGLVQYKRLRKFIQTRINNFTRLREFFARYEEWFVLPRQAENVRTGWLAFPLTVRATAPFGRRELQMHLEQCGVQTRPVFAGNILRQPGYRTIARRERTGGYPNADAVMSGGLLLGCHQGLRAADIDRICGVFGEFAAKF
jgi:CDP-6-deoxy-D-xylo-4-hexulose-3-dehydrase